MNVPKLDLVFALSSTSPDKDETFQLMTDTVKSLLQRYDSSNIRFGLLEYGDDVNIVVDLKNETDAAGMKAELAVIAPSVGLSALDRALEAAKNMFFEAGDRKDADRVLVVMTDKNSLVDEEEIIGATKPLEKMAVKIIPVVIGDEVDPTNFKFVAPKGNIIETNKDEDPTDLGEEIMERVISKSIVLEAGHFRVSKTSFHFQHDGKCRTPYMKRSSFELKEKIILIWKFSHSLSFCERGVVVVVA